MYEPYLVLQYKVRKDFFFSIIVYLLDIFVFGTTFTNDNELKSISNSTTQTPIKQDFYFFFFRYADIRINFKSCIFSICRFLLSQSLFFFQNYWIDYIVHVAKMWVIGGTIFMFYSKWSLINWMIIWNSSRSCVWDTVFRWSSRSMPLLLNEWCDLWQALFLHELSH